MTHQDPPKFYTIPAGLSFVDELARGLLSEYGNAPEKLPDLRILLPTRRAGRTLRDAFLRQTQGRPLLLPRIQPIGDVEDEALSPLLMAPLDEPVPPALEDLPRRLLLARLLMAGPQAQMQSFGQALGLAKALGTLMDRIYTEGLDIGNLDRLAGDAFARHWQVTLDFLKIIAVHWPQILAERGVIDAADRRDRMIRALAARWQASPPPFPVLAAGSTGSIPATALLIRTIAGLPAGRVVLPGLDREMDEESWQAVEDTHPQSALKRLLDLCGLDRKAVALWNEAAQDLPNAERRRLATEITRPAQTSEAWQNRRMSSLALDSALNGLHRYDCATPQEEAATIAVLLRQTLEKPGATAALVTPDRHLARRVARICDRWGIALDDSGGQPLHRTPVGTFLILSARAGGGFSPLNLLEVLHHALAGGGMEPARFRRLVRELDARFLRGPSPGKGWEGLRDRVMTRSKMGRIPETISAQVLDFLGNLETIFAPLTRLVRTGELAPFATLLKAHLEVCETLAATDETPGAARLWRGPEGEAAATCLSDLRSAGDLAGEIDGAQYPEALEALLADIAVRPPYGTHPRLAILGQLEARMVQADRVVLGGLNEGVWPVDPGHDPWMSRPMQRAFGLPAPERSIGASAHDFVAGFCAPEVFLTRSERAGGAPTVPARWLQRLDVVLQAHGARPERLTQSGPHLTLARTLDRLEGPPRGTGRPAPTPPLAARPRRLSVTQVETWLRDPYAIYARSILRLKPLDSVEKEPDMADLGRLLHAALHRFVAAHPQTLPAEAATDLVALCLAEAHEAGLPPGLSLFWKHRFERLAHAFVTEENQWRQIAHPVLLEASGSAGIDAPAGPFILSARADRIDRLTQGTYALIDYKSGGAYGTQAMKNGALPQLPLEACILERGGFPPLPDGSRASSLSYWVVTGKRRAPLEVKRFEDGEKLDLPAIVEAVWQRLTALVAAFDDPATPYYSVPRLNRAPRFNDYAHLARLKEWAALDDPGDEDREEAA